MPNRRNHRPGGHHRPQNNQPPKRRTDLRIVSAGPGRFKLQYPKCVADRADDLAEAEAMVTMGETDCAVDELRWLLEDCRDLLSAHQLLGTIALEAGDFKLARGHFGIVYDLVRESLPVGGLKGTLPYEIAENRVVFESGRGLAHCLRELGMTDLAVAVVRQLLDWDPSDPVKISGWSQ